MTRRLKVAALAEQKTAPAIVNSDHWLSMEVEREVDALWVWWQQNGSADPWHVWFRRGGVRIAMDKPEGYELAFGERVPSNVEKPRLYDWVHRKLWRVPCLPEEL